MSEAYFPVESGALGPEENFLSLDDILMSHEKLPVRTEIPMPRLGVFFQDRSAGAESDHAIPQGSKLELPLWLAKGLFDNKRRVISAELPKLYQQGWRTVFSADANVVDLHKMGPHFYGFGSQLLHFDSPENADISQCLLQMLSHEALGSVFHGTSAFKPVRPPCPYLPAQMSLWIATVWHRSDNRQHAGQLSPPCVVAIFICGPLGLTGSRAQRWASRLHHVGFSHP